MDMLKTAPQNPFRLGIASVPKQQWGELYNLQEALKNGTIFKELDMPFFMGGDLSGK